MMSMSSVFLTVTLLLLTLCARAAPPEGLSFSHNDWQLACDNTGTCRAAGYQSDDVEMAVSVLLTRKAGPRQQVTGELMIGRYGENEVLDQLPPVFNLSMRINEQAVGQVEINKDSLVADLSAEQVAALLASLIRDSKIEWAAGEHRWRLSDKGAAAVLLKMDEFQGRIGSEGALFKKGARGEDAVLQPSAAPVVIAAALANPLPGDDQFASRNSKALRDALRGTIEDDECFALTEEEDTELFITRLTDSKLLTSIECWSAAYNSGYGYWVIDDTPPYHPVLITTSSTDYLEGSIFASQKGRGLGDCWSSDTWTWDGEEFVHTAATSTGLCRLIAPGGAWSLPTIITDVRESSSEPMVQGQSVASLDEYLDMLNTENRDGGELYCESSSGGERHPYDSCASFSALREQGCSGYSMIDIAMESRYAATCAKIDALANAERSSKHYFALESPDWWRALPAEVIPMSGGIYSDESWEAAKLQRDEWVVGKELSALFMTEITSEPGRFAATLELREGECGETRNRIEMKATLLADFDNDGIAELLIEGNRVDRSDTCSLGSGNSLGAAFSVVLKRASPDSQIIVTSVPGMN